MKHPRGHKWSPVQHAKYRATMAVKNSKKLHSAQKKSYKIFLDAPKAEPEKQAPLDIIRIRQENYRRGMWDAVYAIMRELREV